MSKELYGDLLDVASIENAIKTANPDEIYNLAAQSHVRISFEIPQYTTQVNALGVLNVLEAMRKFSPSAKFYQASSSEMFGNCMDADKKQRETTPMQPVSPYGCSKLYAYSIVKNYRNSYNMFATNGILFNHESPRRGSNFVSSKIIKTAVAIKLGKEKELVLGNMDSQRDWGHSYDFVRAMRLILNYEKPSDWVVSTGITRTVRDMCKIVFENLGLNYLDYVRQDEKFMRPEELEYLCGDSSKAKIMLGWQPTYTFESMIAEMTDYWSEKIK